MRLTYGRFLNRDYLNRDHSWEFTYYGINEYSTRDGITSARSAKLDSE